MTDLKVVDNVEPLHPGELPVIDSLFHHIKAAIYDYCDQNKVSNAEVVGILEYVKDDFKALNQE